MADAWVRRYVATRRKTRTVRIGSVAIGGSNPVAVQSMVNTPTQDVRATVAQSIRLAQAGCQIVRITAPNIAAAKALGEIRAAFSAAGFADVPLVADIHFLPAAAMEAALHVEKVRINPGNYADRKIANPVAYSDAEYARELERLRDAVSPLIARCRELGRAIRVGVNHGSLSDRVMNRFGDTPQGMCESALEFLRICRELDFGDIVVSMKASNPAVMLEATRLMAAKMDAEGLDFPLHLGVTEAGGGEDARVKSAAGIGALLRDGLGDTIRVSLTEDPVAEIPVAQALARGAEALWTATQTEAEAMSKLPHVEACLRRETRAVAFGPGRTIGAGSLLRVVAPADVPLAHAAKLLEAADKWHSANPRMPIEATILPVASLHDATALPVAAKALNAQIPFVFAHLLPGRTKLASLLAALPVSLGQGVGILCTPDCAAGMNAALETSARLGCPLALDMTPGELAAILPVLKAADTSRVIITCSRPQPPMHPAGLYRMLGDTLAKAGLACPVWVRHTREMMPAGADALYDASILVGGLVCEGIGDAVSVESLPRGEAVRLSYAILQGTRRRSTRTEFITCPSCGRTLFDLEETARRVRAATGHLQGVTIAVMGCIVNGPGEMAGADFGYVGGAPGMVNLYVGKKAVRINIPSSEAVAHLVDLIKENGRWEEPAQ